LSLRFASKLPPRLYVAFKVLKTAWVDSKFGAKSVGCKETLTVRQTGAGCAF